MGSLLGRLAGWLAGRPAGRSFACPLSRRQQRREQMAATRRVMATAEDRAPNPHPAATHLPNHLCLPTTFTSTHFITRQFAPSSQASVPAQGIHHLTLVHPSDSTYRPGKERELINAEHRAVMADFVLWWFFNDQHPPPPFDRPPSPSPTSTHTHTHPHPHPSSSPLIPHPTHQHTPTHTHPLTSPPARVPPPSPSRPPSWRIGQPTCRSLSRLQGRAPGLAGSVDACVRQVSMVVSGEWWWWG